MSSSIFSIDFFRFPSIIFSMSVVQKEVKIFSANPQSSILDPGALICASTDNTLKLWDLNKPAKFVCSSTTTSSCMLTFKGHTNEKNFVGLSVADGFITCGSETNEVFSYYRPLPIPITSHKFWSIDPISGKDTENESNQFVSSVCWRQKSDMVVAYSFY
ncbi:unnamed protein product [Lactuca virosa]|uniref:Uncharacterized protein n=1 Tax=Lactuca virosa TaxID=75947 RepID=A0AAU9P290_9ASTR|nr:unnamed protein product [Lactuca virosa]